MNTFRVTGGAGVVAIILGLTGISCATHKSMSRINERERYRPHPLARATSTEPEAAAKAKLQATYAKLPLAFERNQGQTDARVKFLSRGIGSTLFLTPTEAVLALRTPQEDSPALTPTASVRKPEPRAQPVEHTVLRLRLLGAHPQPQVVGLEELPGKINYFTGSDPQAWRTDVPTYAKVQYQQVYPGVDLIYYGNQRHLEYDFLIAPGVDPAIIQLAFEGTDHVRLDAQGDLILAAGGGRDPSAQAPGLPGARRHQTPHPWRLQVS